jgi:hypothetical protein
VIFTDAEKYVQVEATTTRYIIVGAMRCELPIIKLSLQLHLTGIHETLPTTFTTSK